MKEFTPNGIMYTWELASSEGASFILFPTKENTKEEIAAAKAELRYNHDVVSLRLASEADRDEEYKADVFRVPSTKPLRWYQIEQDEKLLRRERLAGTTPEQFVERYVLPFTKQTEEKYLHQFGNSIYQK